MKQNQNAAPNAYCKNQKFFHTPQFKIPQDNFHTNLLFKQPHSDFLSQASHVAAIIPPKEAIPKTVPTTPILLVMFDIPSPMSQPTALTFHIPGADKPTSMAAPTIRGETFILPSRYILSSASSAA